MALQPLLQEVNLRPWPIDQRVVSIVFGRRQSQSEVTDIPRKAYNLAASAFTIVLESLRQLQGDLADVEAQADRALAPCRLPHWQPE
jgi:hypothetical protein